MSVIYHVDCHVCGKAILENQGVQRAMQTGTYSKGGAFYRNVNICSKCDTDLDNKDRARKAKAALVITAVLVALVGSVLYVLWLR